MTGRITQEAELAARLTEDVIRLSAEAAHFKKQAAALATSESAALQSQIAARSEADDLAQQVERLTRERDELQVECHHLRALLKAAEADAAAHREAWAEQTERLAKLKAAQEKA